MSHQEDGIKARLRRKAKQDMVKRTSAVTAQVLKHTVGAGIKENHIPLTQPEYHVSSRTVEIGWRPLGGFAGKWVAEKSKLGKMIKDKIQELPDPSQHWAVLVGDFAHQLWIDGNFQIMYTNERVKREEWRTVSVGETSFNDEAIRRAAEYEMRQMREKRPRYNLITNNCQSYALQLVDMIQAEEQPKFATSSALYRRLQGLRAVVTTAVFSDYQKGSEDEEKPVSEGVEGK